MLEKLAYFHETKTFRQGTFAAYLRTKYQYTAHAETPRECIEMLLRFGDVRAALVGYYWWKSQVKFTIIGFQNCPLYNKAVEDAGSMQGGVETVCYTTREEFLEQLRALKTTCSIHGHEIEDPNHNFQDHLTSPVVISHNHSALSVSFIGGYAELCSTITDPVIS
jgi:hypothetical protein